ncbi:MAG: hypothetical protein MTP17_03130 [Candidatus Midichloria sp.]|nr:MAG: hypothetical protein MTP17_03130 [Candidatus Midichloria sp.]
MTDIKANDTVIEKDKDTEKNPQEETLLLAASAVTGIGAITAAVPTSSCTPFIRSISPDANVSAVGSTEVDLLNIKEGETITVM